MSRALMYKEVAGRESFTSCVSFLVPSPLQRPNINIGLASCEYDHIFARWAGSFKSHPARKC